MIADWLVLDLRIASPLECGQLTLTEIDHWYQRITLRKQRRKPQPPSRRGR